MAKQHDHAYKNLFSHPEMVRDLLEGFVKADWLGKLDYGSLEKVNSLRRAFAVWLARVIMRKFKGKPVNNPGDLQEVRTMLADRIDEWGKELEEKGRRKGIKTGRQKGEAAVLLRQMERKFGTVAPETRQRLIEADAKTLLAWSERILTAQNPEEVIR